MKLKYRLVIDENQLLKEYLVGNNVMYDYDQFMRLIFVKIYEDSVHFQRIFDLAKKSHTIITTEYSKEEMEQAEWYSVRSVWRFDYPQPEDPFPKPNYDMSKACSECYYGLYQQDLFQFKKEPDWKHKNFFMTNWVHGELFMKPECAEILVNEGLKGFEIKDVLIYKKNTLANIKQLYVTSELKEGLIVDDGIKKIEVCKVCGVKKYIGSGKPIHFKKEIFENLRVDIIKSKEVFGIWSCNDREIYISKKFYNVLKENKLADKLVIEPMKFV